MAAMNLPLHEYRRRSSLGPISSPEELATFLYKEENVSPKSATSLGHEIKKSPSFHGKDSQLSLVVLGGGFAGSLVAKAMSHFKEWRVTLVDSKAYFSNTPALLQSTLTDLSLNGTIQFASEYCIRHDTYLQAPSRVVVADISLVSPSAVVTTEETIEYDYLVIACGCSYDISPGRALSTRTIGELSFPLKHAPKVVIVGGGPVGVELAAELISAYPDKSITIVANKPTLLNKHYGAHAVKACHEFFTQKGVELILCDTAEIQPDGSVTTKAGRSFPADQYMVLKCLRGQPRTSFLEKHFAFWLDSERYINVNEFFQVGGMSNIFAAGDITSIKEEKLAERVREAKLSNPYFCATRIQAPRAVAHADHIIENLKAIMRNRPLTKRYKPPAKPPLQVITLGPKSAVALSNGKYLDVSGPTALRMKKNFITSVNKRLSGSRKKMIPSRSSELIAKRGSMPKLAHKILVLNPQFALGRAVFKAMVQRVDSRGLRVGVPSTNQRLFNKLKAEADGEVLEYSIDQPHTLSLLMKGVHTLFVNHSLTPMALTELRIILLAAKAAGVQFIVGSHDGGLRPDEDRSILGDWGLEYESSIAESDIAYSIVRHSFLFSDLSLFLSKTVRTARALKLPIPAQLKLAWVHPADVARTITPLLINPQLAANQKVWEISGTTAVTAEEIASAISDAIADTCYFVSVHMKAESTFWADEVGLGAALSDAMISLFSVIRYGSQSVTTTDYDVLALGEPQITIQQWAREEAHHFL